VFKGILAAAALAALLAVGASGAAQPLAQVDVSVSPGTQAEVSIAADPSNPEVLFAASNSVSRDDFVNSTHNLERVYGSVDGGATWTNARAPQAVPVNGVPRCNTGDPTVGIGPGGSQYLAFLGSRCDLQAQAEDDAGALLSLQVAARDGAKGAWRVSPVFPARSLRSDDKPTLTVEQDGPFVGRVYIVWTRFTVTGKGRAQRLRGQIAISHSDDGARLWSKPVIVSDDVATPATFGGVAVDRNGVVFVTWMDASRKILVDRSADGVTFGRDVRVDRAAGRPAGNCRTDGITIPAQADRCITATPVISVDDRAGTAERVYVTYSAPGSDGLQMDSLVAAFDPALAPLLGAPKGVPKLVHPPDARGDQFMSTSATDDEGRLWVCFYDTAGDRTRRSTIFTCTASSDGGATFAPTIRAASTRSNETVRTANGFQFGDYQGIVVAGGVAHPIWTDSRNLRARGEDIYTTALTPATLGL